jgi:eukaryotic-like serine/threonine-protein kinase
MDPTLPTLSPSQPRTGAATGSVIADRFAVGDLIGRGGRGEVYRAVQIDLAREVALKLLLEVDDADARARFLQEARVAAGIRHPCVAEVFDAGVAADGTPYCAMELLVGESLASRLERGALDPSLAVTVAAGVCSALGAVHDKGLVHRDVKPSNIFLARRPDGGVDPKLLDFGVAKCVSLPTDTVSRITKRYGERQKMPLPTAVNVIIGTPRYLSPEQILGRKVDARSDVWALAATLYEALGGAPAFAGASMSELLEKIVVEDPAPLAPRGVAPALERAVMRGLAKEPGDRYASAADFSSALWEAMAETRHGTPIPEASLPVTRYERWFVGAAAAVLLAVLAVVFARSRPPAPPVETSRATTSAPPLFASPSPPPPPLVAPDDPEGARAAATASAAPEPRARGARARAPGTDRADRATLAPTAAPAASTSFKLDDLKTPF